MVNMVSLQPSLVIAGNENPPISDFALKVIAQGDSWFSVGALPPWATSNFLAAIETPVSSCVVNCAHPGDELAHMCDIVNDAEFLNLVRGNVALKWDAIFLSGGGNDLIDALQVPAADPSTGTLHPPALRLLLTKNEWTSDPAPQCYFSVSGWATFEAYFRQAIRAFVEIRDGSSLNKTTPIHCHTYDYPTPRPAPAATWPKHIGPWLYPAMLSYEIPETDWNTLAKLFIDRLAEVLQSFANPLFVVNDTRGAMVPAELDSIGISNDWENEIHPTAGGYAKLAVAWT